MQKDVAYGADRQVVQLFATYLPPGVGLDDASDPRSGRVPMATIAAASSKCPPCALFQIRQKSLVLRIARSSINPMPQ